jgi:isochorismate synthase
MSDVLKYRLPGQTAKIQKFGFFEPIQSLHTIEGFVVSGFEEGHLFRFAEGRMYESEEFSFAENTPPVISQREYLLETQGILNSFEAYGLEKVVYSRVRSLAFNEELLNQVFENLCSTYPKAFVYLISSSHFGTWIGATPEILLHQQNDHLFTMSLAGTRKENDKSDWGDKEAHEQKVVTDYIVDKLQGLKLNDLELNGPYTFSAGPVSHLRTDISCSLGSVTVQEVISALHPTPAICGIPKDPATTLIGQREMHEREFYTGFIGLIGKNESRLFVNLRCAQIFKGKAFLYVGGGLTKASIPELEWEETENKAKTLLTVFESQQQKQ